MVLCGMTTSTTKTNQNQPTNSLHKQPCASTPCPACLLRARCVMEGKRGGPLENSSLAAALRLAAGCSVATLTCIKNTLALFVLRHRDRTTHTRLQHTRLGTRCCLLLLLLPCSFAAAVGRQREGGQRGGTPQQRENLRGRPVLLVLI